MDQLLETLKTEIIKYAGRGANVIGYPLLDDERHHYGIISVDYPSRQEIATVMLMARVVGDQIIIEEDMTDKKLVDALIQAGIPRRQIILAYAGEALPQEI